MRRRKRMLKDLDQDIREHVAIETQDNIERGMSPEEARYAALRKFGNVTRVQEETREVWSFIWMEQLWQDIRYGLRMLAKSPGFTAVAILTLALGIGANTAIFSLIDAVMLRSLPVENPSQLVLLKWSARSWPNIHGYKAYDDCPMNVLPGTANPSGCSLSEPMFREIAQANVFSEVTAFANTGRLDLSGNGPASVINGQVVSGNFFRTMNVKATVGRVLEPSDDSPSAAPVAVLNYGYWQSAFGGSRDVVGRTIELNNVSFTIIGVAEQRFIGITPGSDYDVWLPLSDARITDPIRWRNWQDDVSIWWLTIIGRVKPETLLAQTQAAVSGLFRNEMLHGSVPLSTAANIPEVTLVPAQSGLTGSRTKYSEPLYVLMLAVGIILLIACTNVAGLMLARAATRQKEMAVRLALGAGRTRIVRQLLTESMMLSVVGGILGILFAYWAAYAIISFVSSNQTQPLGFATGIDTRVLLFTVAISLLTGILFGIAPAFRSVRVDLTPTLKEGSSTSSGHPGGKWFSSGNALVVAQMALTVIVLVGAGLLVRTLQNLRDIDLGFDSHNILIFGIDPTLIGYKSRQIDNLYRDLQSRLAETPGVKSVSYSGKPLLSGGLWGTTGFHWPGTPQDQESQADDLYVGPNFFETMHIPLLAGRSFNASDFEVHTSNSRDISTSASTPVIVNQAFVKKFLGTENPLGKEFGQSAGDENGPASSGYEIIGVVCDAKYNDLRRGIQATMYTPHHLLGASFELRTVADPQAILPAVRKVVAQVNEDLPLFNVTTESEQIDRLLFQERLVARLASFFGLLALVLACIGLYGVLSYEVSRRTREIGIRMALGAHADSILYLIVKQGITLVVVGAILGIGVAFAVMRYLASMLYDVHADDPLTMIAVTMLLTLLALAACYIPARRAMRADPMVALRSE